MLTQLQFYRWMFGETILIDCGNIENAQALMDSVRAVSAFVEFFTTNMNNVVGILLDVKTGLPTAFHYRGKRKIND